MVGMVVRDQHGGQGQLLRAQGFDDRGGIARIHHHGSCAVVQDPDIVVIESR